MTPTNAVPCNTCNAEAGQPCVKIVDAKPLICESFHFTRVLDALVVDMNDPKEKAKYAQ